MTCPETRRDEAAPQPIPRGLALSARELLIRTCELPASRRELLAVLSEHRAAVHALVAASGQL